MIKTESFFVLFLLFYCPIAAAAATLLYVLGYYHYLKDVLWGSAVSVFLIWITVFCTYLLFESSISRLLILVYGGMVFRFLFVLGAGVFVRFMTDLHLAGFVLGLLFSYIVLQILEIVYVQKRFWKRIVIINERRD